MLRTRWILLPVRAASASGLASGLASVSGNVVVVGVGDPNPRAASVLGLGLGLESGWSSTGGVMLVRPLAE